MTLNYDDDLGERWSRIPPEKRLEAAFGWMEFIAFLKREREGNAIS